MIQTEEGILSLQRKAFFTRKFSSVCAAGILAFGLFAAGASIGPGSVRAAETVSIKETGSSLLYPLFNIWIPHYVQVDPRARIATASTGSGEGISKSVSGEAQIGASDAYMSDELMEKHSSMLNIPLCISMQMVNYNLPNLNNTHLKLSGPVLAAIYNGDIRYWNDPAITSINPGVKLPHHVIIPVHRTDGSGDTFIFTQYLSFSYPRWSMSTAFGTSVDWPPVTGSVGAKGNPGMIEATKDNLYSISYIGTSYQDAIEKNHLGTAMLGNRAGYFVLPSAQTAGSAAGALVPRTPDHERISLILAPGRFSYPIINYEYVLINAKQDSPKTAAALRSFLNWAISPNGGNAPRFMEQVHFIPLPKAVAKLSKAQIAKIE
jgi:phosphate transport system substrate-binding protein